MLWCFSDCFLLLFFGISLAAYMAVFFCVLMLVLMLMLVLVFRHLKFVVFGLFFSLFSLETGRCRLDWTGRGLDGAG